MIKLGCNAMLPVAAELPQTPKDNPANWIDIEELVHFIHGLRLDIIDFQLFRGFRSTDPNYLRRLKILCQRCGLPIGFLGVGSGFVGVESRADGTTVGTALDPDNPPSAIQMERGTVTLTKSDGTVTTTYEAGDKVYISLKDSDRNGDAGAVDEVKVLITTETENTGTKASAGAVTAGSGNQGDGTLTVSKTGYDTKTEDWTLTCVSVQGNPSFKVVGSVSGEQQSQYGIGSSSYTSDNAEVTLSITQGSTGFGILDTFKFSTTAGDVSGEEITLTETGADTGIFSAEVEMDKIWKYRRETPACGSSMPMPRGFNRSRQGNGPILRFSSLAE